MLILFAGFGFGCWWFVCELACVNFLRGWYNIRFLDFLVLCCWFSGLLCDWMPVFVSLWLRLF